jgi:hypothetical protein
MGKRWPYRKTKNGHEENDSRFGKKPLVGRYARIKFVRHLWEENRPVPWPDTCRPGGGCYLNSNRVPVPPVPREGQESRQEVRRRQAILPPDLWDDPTFTLTSYNWISFRERGFDAARRAGYLGNVDLFTCELDDEDDYDDEGEYEDDDEDETMPFRSSEPTTTATARPAIR